jgi:hypothetical protein
MVRDLEQVHYCTYESLLVKWLEMLSAHGWVLPVQGIQNSNEQVRLKTGKTYLLYRLVTELRDSHFKDNLRWNSSLEAAKSEASEIRHTRNPKQNSFPEQSTARSKCRQFFKFPLKNVKKRNNASGSWVFFCFIFSFKSQESKDKTKYMDQTVFGLQHYVLKSVNPQFLYEVLKS